MQANWAEENLQIMRTLMERSAVYRRALAPIMITIGTLGIIASILGMLLRIVIASHFITYWVLVSIVALGLAFFLARRQAMEDKEPFWSGPTRRVAQALLPGLFVGLIVGALISFASAYGPLVCSLLALMWVMLYGCAMHAAGFFTPAGMKWLAWLFILGGAGLSFVVFACDTQNMEIPAYAGNAVMGLFFGLLQLAYGLYLYVSKAKQNPA